MSSTTDEHELQNGVHLESVPESESETTSESLQRSEPEPELEPQGQSEAEPESELLERQPEPTSAPEVEPEPVVMTDADREPEEEPQSKEAAIQSNESQIAPSNEEISSSELRKDEGSRTFTMRELLSELKDGEGNESAQDATPATPYSQQSTPHTEQNNAAMDLIGSVTGVDEESRSRQRILTFAAKRYANAIERNPEDYDALYNWALVLQESADNVSPDSTSPSKDALLEEACKKYDEATRLCPTLHDAYYNWAIAISDRAKMRGRTKEAEELWKQSAANYEKAVQLNWNSPQALNNWGLALQELSAIVQIREKPTIVRTAISKFRSAIMLQYDFHRAIYNLGTVLYGLAEDTAKESVNAKDVPRSPSTELYSQSAIYIAAAHALRPNYSVYSSALRLVRSMLPLPFLKVGYLTAPPVGTPVAPHKDWKRSQFLLSHEGLDQVTKVEQKHAPQSLSGKPVDVKARKGISVDIADIVSVSTCADLTLPPGAGLCINTINDPVYLVADSWESLDGWLDAIRLVYTIHARGKGDVLAGILTS